MSAQPFSVPSAAFDDHDDDDDDDALSQRQCISCRLLSPKTHTAHTLISAQYGWRLARVALPEGGHRLEWRCPPCWTKFKAAKILTR